MRIETIDDRGVLIGLDSPGDYLYIPLDAIATYSALLGTDDPAETVLAIAQIRDQAQADPNSDDADTWAETMSVLAGGTPDQAEHRAEIIDAITDRQNPGKGVGPNQPGKGQATAPGQQAKAARQAAISAAQSKARNHWNIAPPGQVKKAPDLAPLNNPDLAAEITRRRAAWIDTITPILPEDQIQLEDIKEVN